MRSDVGNGCITSKKFHSRPKHEMRTTMHEMQEQEDDAKSNPKNGKVTITTGFTCSKSNSQSVVRSPRCAKTGLTWCTLSSRIRFETASRWTTVSTLPERPHGKYRSIRNRRRCRRSQYFVFSWEAFGKTCERHYPESTLKMMQKDNPLYGRSSQGELI